MANITTVRTTSLAAATSANGTARNGTAIALNSVDPGTLLFECTSAITTSSVLATFKVQTSYDNSTWFDLTSATWASAAGTGSPVTTRQTIAVPIAAQGHRWARIVATLSGAATAGADQTTVVASYVPIGRLWGLASPG